LRRIVCVLDKWPLLLIKLGSTDPPPFGQPEGRLSMCVTIHRHQPLAEQADKLARTGCSLGTILSWAPRYYSFNRQSIAERGKLVRLTDQILPLPSG
jgi:hypothetical protein